jgi:hypothetical protein
VVDDTEPEVESDLRRRAAWLLGMLAVVAVLFVVVMTTLVGTDSGGGSNNGVDAGPLDGAVASPSSHSSAPRQRTSSTASSPTTHARGSTAASSVGHHSASCPTSQPCALDDDIGNAVNAVNAYRTQHGLPAVPGAVSQAAKACALANGSGCSGGWAESQVPGPSGTAAVNKIVQFGKLLDPQMKSFGVGWAYDPAGKQYFFAIVRND